MNQDEKEVQRKWTEETVRDLIRRMLLYYDPMDLMIFGAPDDEYDSYVNRIFSFLLEKFDQNSLEGKIFDLFEKKRGDNKDWLRKARRMAEDLFYFLERKDNFDFTVQIHPRNQK